MVRPDRMSRWRSRDALSILAVLSAMALVVLDAGLINVALPSLARSLGVAPAQIIMAVSCYQAALVVGLLPSAHVAERFGERRVFIAGLLLFTAASVGCANAVNLPMLLIARVLQGLGGGAIMALGVALLRSALGTDRLGMAIGWNALTVAVCGAAAPFCGAAIVAIAPWPWLFMIKLPLAAVSLFASMALPVDRRRASHIDIASLFLHVGTCCAFMVAAQIGADHGWVAISITALAIASATMMILRGRHAKQPVWPTDLLALRPLRISVAASICCFTAQSAGLIALPFHLQLNLGSGPLGAGTILSLWPLTVAATSVVAGRVSERFGSPLLCVVGGMVLGSGLLLSTLHTSNMFAQMAAGAALCGLGFGLFQVPNNRTLFLAAPAHRSAAAGGMQGTARVVGQTTGAMLMGWLFATASTQNAPTLGFAVGFLFAFAAAAISSLALVERAEPRFRKLRNVMAQTIGGE